MSHVWRCMLDGCGKKITWEIADRNHGFCNPHYDEHRLDMEDVFGPRKK